MHPAIPSDIPAETPAGRDQRVLRVEDLAGWGVSRATADRRVRNGDWQRAASGLYVPHRTPPDTSTLAAAGQHYVGSGGLVTGLLAADALHLRWVPTATRAAVLIGAERRLRSTRLIQVRRCATLPAVRSWVRDDVTFAAAQRAVFDGALQLCDLRSVRGLVLGAIADRRTTVEEQGQILRCEPRNGTALLRRALRDAERGCASPPEAELVDSLIGCRVPFLVNPEIYVDDVLVGCADVWFVGLGCGSEMDSRERHAEEDDFDATLARHDVFGGYGLVLSHLTPRRFRRDPAAAVTAVLKVVRTRLDLPAPLREPRGLRVVARGPVLR